MVRTRGHIAVQVRARNWNTVPVYIEVWATNMVTGRVGRKRDVKVKVRHDASGMVHGICWRPTQMITVLKVKYDNPESRSKSKSGFVIGSRSLARRGAIASGTVWSEVCAVVVSVAGSV